MFQVVSLDCLHGYIARKPEYSFRPLLKTVLSFFFFFFFFFFFLRGDGGGGYFVVVVVVVVVVCVCV